MRIDCGKSPARKWQDREGWHPYFAWWPVRVAEKQCAWLEWVERRGTYHRDNMFPSMSFWTWEFRVGGDRPS